MLRHIQLASLWISQKLKKTYQTETHNAKTHELLYSTGDVVFLASGRRQFRADDDLLTTRKRKCFNKRARATLFEGDHFSSLIFTEEEIVEVNEKEISGSLEEIVARNSKLELTENEFHQRY